MSRELDGNWFPYGILPEFCCFKNKLLLWEKCETWQVWLMSPLTISSQFSTIFIILLSSFWSFWFPFSQGGRAPSYDQSDYGQQDSYDQQSGYDQHQGSYDEQSNYDQQHDSYNQNQQSYHSQRENYGHHTQGKMHWSLLFFFFLSHRIIYILSWIRRPTGFKNLGWPWTNVLMTVKLVY